MKMKDIYLYFQKIYIKLLIMNKFTIKDLSEGRCAVKNDGTVEELNKVLRAAFPKDVQSYGACRFYHKGESCNWVGFDNIENFQSVKDFLAELEKPEFPKKGDRILVSNNGITWSESIFLTYAKAPYIPVICVAEGDEDDFESGCGVNTTKWTYWKPLPEKKTIKVTKKEIAEKYGVDEIEIID